MKKINQNKLLAGIFALSFLTACDFEEINTNPFEVTEEMGKRDGFAVGGSITAMERTVFPVGTQANDTKIINEYQTSYNLSADSWSGYFGQNKSSEWNGGSNNLTYWLMDDWVSATYKNSYTEIIPSWKKVKLESEKADTPEVFALAQIVKISAWHKTLESFGPIAYTHAGEAALVIPFDSEKEVYDAMFKDLADAIVTLTPKARTGGKIVADYDVVYGGDARKWVRYANSLMLRLAMHIRYAAEETAKTYALQALKQEFGVMTDKSDEAQVSAGAGFVFRNNIEWLSVNYTDCRMGSSMYSYLLGYQDPRLSAYFKSSDSEQATEAFDKKKYQAVPPGHVYAKNDVFKAFSEPNIISSTPTYWMRASEVYFLRAEAALKWKGEFGDAESLYKQGIAMSFAENGVDSSVDSYMAKEIPPVGHATSSPYKYTASAPTTATTAFSGTSEQKLEKIMIQKWIALYPNGQEAWTEWRRTGYPKLNEVQYNRGGSEGVTKKEGIRRMKYPNKFSTSADDKANYEEALKLLGGDDKPSTKLWWDCKNGQL